jgi:lipopolysaccharide export system permease protein
MTLIERYILRIAFAAFVACLLALTGVIWITQALRELDLLTSKGQTLLVFLTVTGLSLPALVTVIAPVALFIASIYALNRLNSDSELIVMSAAGMRPRRLLRPFLVLASFVAAGIAVMTLHLMPASFRDLRDLVTRIRADFVANVVKEGQFTSLENGITFHYRERAGDGLLGIFIQDRREKNRPIVYLAERGQTVTVNGHSYLVLENGGVQRTEPSSRDSSIVVFDRYAVDLEAFTPSTGEIVYKPRERSTTELLFPDPTEAYYKAIEGRFRAELHDRLSAWLYPLAMILIAFAALGDARTTRQGRGVAIAVAVVAVAALRIAGFAASSAAVRSPAAVAAVYAVPVVGVVVPLFLILNGSAAREAARKLSAWTGLSGFRLPSLRRA